MSSSSSSAILTNLADVGKTETIPYSIDGTADAGLTYAAAPTGMVLGLAGGKSTGKAANMSFGLRVTLTPGQDVSTDKGDFTDTVDVGIDIAP